MSLLNWFQTLILAIKFLTWKRSFVSKSKITFLSRISCFQIQNGCFNVNENVSWKLGFQFHIEASKRICVSNYYFSQVSIVSWFCFQVNLPTCSRKITFSCSRLHWNFACINYILNPNDNFCDFHVIYQKFSCNSPFDDKLSCTRVW